MSDNNDKSNKAPLVGSELDDLEADFNFNSEDESDDTIEMYSEADSKKENKYESEQSESKRSPKTMIMLSVLILIIISIVSYLFISGFNFNSVMGSQNQAKTIVQQPVIKPIDPKPISVKKIEKLIATSLSKNNNELFLRINGIISKDRKAQEEDLLSLQKSTLAQAKIIADDFLNKKIKEWDEQDDNYALENEAYENAKAQELNKRFTALTSANKKMATQIGSLESKINDMSILFASTKAELNEKNANVKLLMSELENLRAGISKSSATPHPEKEKPTQKKKSISSFQSYELIGFDRQKKSVWIKDDNDNVIKIRKSSFMPEYGTVMSITDDGKIVTELGFVKYKTANN